MDDSRNSVNLADRSNYQYLSKFEFERALRLYERAKDGSFTPISKVYFSRYGDTPAFIYACSANYMLLFGKIFAALSLPFFVIGAYILCGIAIFLLLLSGLLVFFRSYQAKHWKPNL